MSSSSSQTQIQDQQNQQASQNQQYFSESNSNLDIFSDILFGQQQQQQQQATPPNQLPSEYNFSQTNRLVEHSNSSSETLVANSDNTHHFGSNDSIASTSHRYSHQQQTPIQSHSSIESDTEKKLFFDRSTSEDLGLLTLRSNSDPTIALHSLQQSRLQQQNTVALTDISQNVPVQTQINHPANTVGIPESSLPSFQETYPIKYNQLENFGLKMDEDCYNIAQSHQNNMNYHHGHQHQHHVMHQEHFEYQQNPTQFMTPNFYPYEQQSMVSF